MIFESHWAFFLFIAIPFLVYFRFRYQKLAGLRFSSIRQAQKAGRSWRQRLLFLPFLLRILALSLLIIALARPQEGKEEVRDISKGIAIYMVVDRSSSMGAEMSYGNKRLNRLEVVKRVFQEFVEGNKKDLPGRKNDLIGMIAFARYADTICPLTLSHGALGEFLKSIHLVRRRSEDGTAIGDALALAAARLKTAEQTLANQLQKDSASYKIKSKVIILLTDGEYNCGKRTPEQAAQLAKQWGIKIYAIGIGGGESFTTISTPLGNYKVPLASGVNQAALEHLAKITGGICRLASDADSLKSVYKEIDKMEKSEIESVRYLDYKELFSPFALAALILLVLEVILSCTIFRRIP